MNNKDVEKAIKGLECCIIRDPDDKPRCKECPYDGYCLNRLKQDALTILNHVIPHVMTAQEAENTSQHDVVWKEIRSTKKLVPLTRIKNEFKNKKDYLLLNEVTDCDDYLKDYRLWDLEPSKEQMNNAQWKPRFGKWLKASGGMSPGGTPSYACCYCGYSKHLLGAEFPKRKLICDYCGSINAYPWEKILEE